jgi:NRAMP (natural resistance-associated macrophage protein)-like metal ion transporter
VAMKFLRRWKIRILLFLAVVGPGFITANVDNDAGGILTYSSAGAQFGHLLLWTMIPITLALIVVQEMSARMGAVTGKGLSDLIREEFGFRITFFMMIGILITNFGNVVTEFIGIATSLELFGLSRFITVPICGLIVWWIVVKGQYKTVEKVFLAASFFYLTYIVAGFLARPLWKDAAIATVKLPALHEFRDQAYLFMVIGVVGTTIAPWMQFYLQAAVVEKGITANEYRTSRVEVVVGCVMTSVIAFFIIVACAGAYRGHPTDIQSAKEAALALKPFGEYTFLLFSAGLLNASVFAACILPLSTAYSVCEGLGFESGVNRRWREAPIFYWLYTLLIAVGAGIVLFPKFSMVQMILLSQVLNGMLLPVILIFMLLLINRKNLMKEWINPPTYNAVAWATVAIVIGMTLALTGISIRNPQ